MFVDAATNSPAVTEPAPPGDFVREGGTESYSPSEIRLFP